MATAQEVTRFEKVLQQNSPWVILFRNARYETFRTPARFKVESIRQHFLNKFSKSRTFVEITFEMGLQEVSCDKLMKSVTEDHLTKV